MKKIQAYVSIFRMKTAEGFQYRLAGFSGALVGVFWALVKIMVFRVFYLHADHAQAGILANMTFQQLVTYEWLSQALFVMQPMNIDAEILNQIISGDVAIEMCRPLGVYPHWFAKTAANRFIPFLWRGSATLLIGFLMPTGYRLSIPASFIGLLCALLSLFIALLLCSTYAMLMYAIRLGVTWGEGPTYILMLMGGVLSGGYLPLQLWPEFMQKFLFLQPFAGYLDIPIRLYIGSVRPSEAVYALGMQLLWVVCFILLGRWVMNRQMSKIIVQGG